MPCFSVLCDYCKGGLCHPIVTIVKGGSAIPLVVSLSSGTAFTCSFADQL